MVLAAVKPEGEGKEGKAASGGHGMRQAFGPVVLIVLGSALALAPLWGILLGMFSTALMTIQAFSNASGAPGQAVTDYSASHIGTSMRMTIVGSLVMPIGVLLLAGGIVWLVRSRRTRPVK
jgi:hypothetical protein